MTRGDGSKLTILVQVFAGTAAATATAAIAVRAALIVRAEVVAISAAAAVDEGEASLPLPVVVPAFLVVRLRRDAAATVANCGGKDADVLGDDFLGENHGQGWRVCGFEKFGS